MKSLRKFTRGIKAICGAGVVLAGSCSAAEVNAIIDGIEVATQGLDEANQDEVTFTDWLESELD